jgi:hypothetical protein
MHYISESITLKPLDNCKVYAIVSIGQACKHWCACIDRSFGLVGTAVPASGLLQVAGSYYCLVGSVVAAHAPYMLRICLAYTKDSQGLQTLATGDLTY